MAPYDDVLAYRRSLIRFLVLATLPFLILSVLVYAFSGIRAGPHGPGAASLVILVYGGLILAVVWPFYTMALAIPLFGAIGRRLGASGWGTKPSLYYRITIVVAILLAFFVPFYAASNGFGSVRDLKPLFWLLVVGLLALPALLPVTKSNSS